MLDALRGPSAGGYRRWRQEAGGWLALALLVVSLALAIAWAPLPLGVGLVGGSILAGLILIEPRIAFVLLPFLVPFGSLGNVALGPAQAGPMEAVLGLFFAAWLARGVARREIRFRWPPLWGLLMLWLGTQLFSALVTFSLADSLAELVKWGEFAFLYLLASQELRRRDIPLVLGAMLLAGAMAAGHGLVQSVLRIGPDGFLFPLAGRTWMRAYGTFIQPNPFGGYLGVTLPLAYGIIAVLLGLGTTQQQTTEGGERQGGWLSGSAVLLFCVLTGGLMLLALFFSLSRGAWIGATVAAVAVGALLSRRALGLSILLGVLGALAAALGAVGLLPPALRERATNFLPYLGFIDLRQVGINPENFAIIERLAHWDAAINMFSAHPLLGVGIGGYSAAYPIYQQFTRWTDPLGHAHNIYLNFAAETGGIGVLAYLLFWGAALFYSWRVVRDTSGLARGVAVGVLGALVHLATHNFFDNLFVHGIYLHLALLLAFLVVLARDAEETASAGP